MNLQSQQAMIGALIIVVALFVSSYITVKLVVRLVSRFSVVLDPDSRKVKRLARYAIVLLFLLLLGAASPFAAVTEISEEVHRGIRQILKAVFIVGLTGFILSLYVLFEDMLLLRYEMDVADNLASRKVHTQVQIFRKIIFIVVLVIAFLSILMSFEAFRKIGTTLLASAGIAGLIVGLSAQKTIGAFLSGLQLAIAQPVRLDDVVVVEGEWGKIEELTLTYVVIKTWDLRRLVVPTTYFLEKPFQNWTRVSSDILGTVFIYTDYSVPVQDLRDELYRIASAQPEWDGKVLVLQVTGTSERTVELRALMSSSNSGKAFDLRCAVREKMIDYIKQNFPDSLPRSRVEVFEGVIDSTSNSSAPH